MYHVQGKIAPTLTTLQLLHHHKKMEIECVFTVSVVGEHSQDVASLKIILPNDLGTTTASTNHPQREMVR